MRFVKHGKGCNVIKAIETQYRGYNFRSRLEARWAVFFDALHIKWEYEVEGFDLGEFGWYLPDFWLPDLEFFVEIKPEMPGMDQWGKYELFTAMRRIILIGGSPWEYQTYDFGDGEMTECADLGVWGQCPICRTARFGFRSDGEFNGSDCDCRPSSELFTSDPAFDVYMQAAVDSARSARFEYGEAPGAGHRVAPQKKSRSEVRKPHVDNRQYVPLPQSIYLKMDFPYCVTCKEETGVYFVPHVCIDKGNEAGLVFHCRCGNCGRRDLGGGTLNAAVDSWSDWQGKKAGAELRPQDDGAVLVSSQLGETRRTT